MNADDCLIACPACARWPMVVNTVPKKWGISLTFTYVCVGCGYTQPHQRPGKSHPVPAA